MHRCLQLASLARGNVAPNPLVGSVLVYNDTIIGEGNHMEYGQAHAEVNCLDSVKEENKKYIEHSTLYVSLEPCAHFGKTPPCADLIIRNGIPRVVIGIEDPFVQVNGKGIQKLKEAGIEVITHVLHDECLELNRRFFIFHTLHRPFVLLKWAQTSDGKIASTQGKRLLISNEFTNRKVHQWRTEETAILIGTNTALTDDPTLTARLWPGKSPVRLVIDMDLKLPPSLAVFNGDASTIIFNLHLHTLQLDKGRVIRSERPAVHYYQVTTSDSLVHQVLNALYHLNIQSVMVEGGAQLLQSFIDEGRWDEARVITNETLLIGQGLPAPVLMNQSLMNTQQAFSDRIEYLRNNKSA